jgi:hypothetical protein
MIGGAAVAGYLIWTKFLNKSGATAPKLDSDD